MVKGQQRHLQCVIPCGGNSTRLGQSTNKCLAHIRGKPVLYYVVEFWKRLGMEDFVYIVGGDDSKEVREYTSTLSEHPTFVDRGDVTNLAKAIGLTEPHVGNHFVLALGDCLNFGEFVSPLYPGLAVGVCIATPNELRKSYSVHLDGMGVTKMVEKPKRPIGLCGMGTYFFNRKMFEYIRRLRLPDQATSVDLTGALQLAAGAGEIIHPVLFKGDYINITYPDDIKKAEELVDAYTS